MTICIGVICEKGRCAVAVADRMVTGPDVEFEQDELKIDKLSGCCMALTAGSALDHVDLLRDSAGEIAEQTAPSVSSIVDILKDRFAALRRQRAEESNLKPLGLDIPCFLDRQGTMNETVVLGLNHALEHAELEVEVLVAGVDKLGAHLYLVSDPGTSECYDSIGFCAIGSGMHHAEMTLIRNSYSKSMDLNKAVYLAYEAKRKAEIAPGVGDKYTDVALVTEHGTRFLTEEEKEKLDAVYRAKSDGERAALREVQSQIEGLPFHGGA